MSMVHVSLSPNVENDDRRLAISFLFSPWKWAKGKESKKLQQELSRYLGISQTPFLFNSGRSALFTLLQSLNISSSEEILVQAFTCNAVVNPIIWRGTTPVYVDIDKRYNMDVNDLVKKITPKSKAIIIQHTFGIPANIEEIIRIAKEHDLFVIEDCAHSLGAEYGKRKVGTFGDAAFFSFGRDKVISSVYGGALVVYRDSIRENLMQEYRALPLPTACWTIQQLVHPVILTPIIFTYWSVGKYLLFFLQKLRILSKAVTYKEKHGEKPSYFPSLLPNALAGLACAQLKKIEYLNDRRKYLARFYSSSLSGIRPLEGEIFLRYPVQCSARDNILQEAKKNKILLGDWYDSVIAPKDTDLKAMRYTAGSCPNAERISKEILNLPTHINITDKDAQTIVRFLSNACN